MSAKSLLGLVCWGLLLGLVAAVFSGERRLISIQVWLAAFCVWFGAMILIRLFREVQLPRDRLLGQWPLPRRNTSRVSDGRPVELRNLEVLLQRASSNPRAHHKQLRPRLERLAQHYLPVHHGLDPKRHPEQVAALLGDTAWLIDGSTANGAGSADEERTPTLDDITRFLDRVVPQAPASQPASLGKGPS